MVGPSRRSADLEAVLLLLDALVMLVFAYTVLLDDRRGPNQLDRSLFRMAADRLAKPDSIAIAQPESIGALHAAQRRRER